MSDFAMLIVRTSVLDPDHRDSRFVCDDQDGTGGRMAVLSSSHMFSDQYLDKEHNERAADILFQWMAGQLPLNSIDAEAPDLSDYQFLPDTSQLSETLRVCLQDGEEVTLDPICRFRVAASYVCC